MTLPTTSRSQQPPDVQQPRTDGSIIIATSPLAWVAKLAKRLLAQSLNMPEPLLHDTGVFVFAHVQAAEDRALKTFCPFTLLRRYFTQRRGHNF